MSILEEAMKVTGQERPKDYVNPFDDFTCTGRIWAAMIKVRFGVELDLTPEFVGLMMAAMKVSREAGREKHDNLVDIAGYAECVGKIKEERKLRKQKTEALVVSYMEPAKNIAAEAPRPGEIKWVTKP